MLDRCVANVTAAYPGTVENIDRAWEQNTLVYEMDVLAADGKRLEAECVALTGRIVEVEQEDLAVPRDAFKSMARLSDLQARHLALQTMPGSILDVERELELNGSIVYEYEIQQADGTIGEVEIDARTGRVLETGYELADPSA